MSLSELINIFIQDNSTTNIDEDNKAKKRTITSLKNDSHLKNLSKYVRGGISKMTKNNLTILTDGLKSYKNGSYMVGGKEIIPDSEQDMIINAPIDKNIRVVAGAGTGKTTTITCRIKYLLDTCTTPDRILVLTFNVEARKNLEMMIDRLMGFEIKMDIRTIDSFCLKIKNDFYGGYEADNMPDNQQGINRSVSEFGIVGRKLMEKYGAEIASQYKYVFFDEFQDVDDDQFQILNIFARNGCFLTVIGDDSQNIYQFRGSDNYYIINFDKIITNTLTYKITTNYRSTKEIVELANDSIKNNKDKIFKLMTEHTKEKGSIDLTIFETDYMCIENIIQKIIYYAKDQGINYGDIAILSRNTHPLKNLETEFEKYKLPYVALISDQYSNEYKQVIQQNKIVLSTIHKSKGLEWRIVFIIGLCDAYFPNHLNNGLKNIEEERRLFYVGTTRAKRNLHFIGSIKEIPLSRFIGEISHHLEIENKSNMAIDPEVMFLGSDENKIKESYPVMQIVEMLSGRRIEKLRELQLIPKTKLLTEQIFTEPLCFTDEIKKNVFESDYGIYCDYYMTRQLMILNKQDIKDVYVEKILFSLFLTEDEIILYKKYNLKDCLIKKKEPAIDPKYKDEIEHVKDLLIKLNEAIKRTGLSANSVEQLLLMGVQDYQYPKSFIKKLKTAYDIYKNNKRVKIDKDVLQSIYQVSLCPKLNNNRCRLVYRNIEDMYKENSISVLPRIDEYIKKISKNQIICKLQMHKQFKIDKFSVSLVGELDYIDITNDTLIDIKSSESDFKVEWLVQLLIYYSLFMCNPKCCKNYTDIKIKKIGIINIFTGKYYQIALPENYDWQGMLEYVKGMISDDLKGVRDRKEEHLEYEFENNQLEYVMQNPESIINNDIYEIIKFNNNAFKSGYMVMDVENNITNMDIIQLAYIIYDENHNEVKKVNSYIKNRFVDNRTGQITGITTDILRQKGIEFIDVMRDFIEDVASIKVICGHHVYTDISKLKSNMNRYKLKTHDQDANDMDIFKDVKIDDTSSLYKTVKGKGRSVTLQNMYEELFDSKMIYAHDALSDVIHTAKCYVELKNQINKLVNKSDIKKLIKNESIMNINDSAKSNKPIKKMRVNSALIADNIVSSISDNSKNIKPSNPRINNLFNNTLMANDNKNIKSSFKTKKIEKNTSVAIESDKKNDGMYKNSKSLEQGLSAIMNKSFFN